MKIVFFGTPDFAIPTLKKIYASKHKLVCVVTAPDKARGRGRKVTFTPVKEFAVNNDIPVLQPDKLKDETFVSALKEFDADLFIIVAFRILPVEVFTLPKIGSFNLHGSLLPKYRGAAPIQWAIINGDTKTGLTTFFLEKKVDTGNILLQKEIEIEPEDDFGTLHDKMSEIGADLVLETISLIEKGNYELKNQNAELATKAPKITKEIAKIDWEKSAEQVVNLIRGLSPFPGAYFILHGKYYKVFKAKVAEQQLATSEILQTKKQIFIGTGDKSIEILEIQPEGRRRMTADEFLRGYSLLEEKS
jgi:methionyl-tRNA formyltransferase